MFKRARIRGIGASIGEIFAMDSRSLLERASKEWLEVSPHTAEAVSQEWSIRIKYYPTQERTLCVVLEPQHAVYKQSRLVCQLLGLPEPAGSELKLKGHVLVVDDNASVRRVTTEVLKEFKCICHSAATHEEAIRLFAHDPDIQYIILDYEMPGSDAKDLIQMIKARRPTSKIIGSTAADHTGDFLALVDYFLPKPWLVEQLIEVLASESRPVSTQLH